MPATTRDPLHCRALAIGFALCLGALTALPATAEVKVPDDGGVSVGGRLTNDLHIKEMSNTSDGEKARTTLRANTIENTAVGGNLTNQTTIDQLILSTQGQGAVSEIAIGVISDTAVGGDLDNSVVLGTSSTIAIGSGARACTELGTIGRSGICR
jgi:hypothetical protein